VDDKENPLLHAMRLQVYHHVSKLIDKPCRILELNAGTGIDALHFAHQGHRVLATDVSRGMIEQIERKANQHNLLAFRRLSYDRLDQLNGQQFDFVFSNFGGLNCIDDLSKVTKNIKGILSPGGYVTWVIMPPVCLWEVFTLFKGNRNALRRFRRGGVTAHLEGERFRIWYHSLSRIKSAFGAEYKLVALEGLAALTPPPAAADFPGKHPMLYRALQRADSVVRNFFPFNRWADHLVVSFQLVS
jgi:SAM-dependent methyltransferase